MAEKKTTAKSSAKSKKRRFKLSDGVIIALIGAGATIIAALLPTLFKDRAIISTETPNITPSSSVFDPHPDPSDFADDLGVPMRLVDAGEYTIGSDDGNANEQPINSVYLNSFYIDKYEVTNALYKLCVDEGVCNSPKQANSETRSIYYENPEFDIFPVIYVDWNMARTYCEWRGAYLPTEAQWEKAARGSDRRKFPWGNDIDCSKANYNSCVGDTTKIGSYEDGKSPYEVYDMAGNVWEWVSSLDKPYPYLIYDGRENLNIAGNRQMRGGPWYTPISGEILVRSSARTYYYQADFSNYLGFRCAKDINP